MEQHVDQACEPNTGSEFSLPVTASATPDELLVPVIWADYTDADWFEELRATVKILIYRWNSGVRSAIADLEAVGHGRTTPYKASIDLRDGLQNLWRQWIAFSTAEAVTHDVIKESPIYFNYTRELQRMRKPPFTATEWASVFEKHRKRCGSIRDEFDCLRKVVEEASWRIEDAVEDSTEGGRCSPNLPALSESLLQDRSFEYSVDQDGCALTNMYATSDNYQEIVALLPREWGSVICFMKHAWEVPILPSDARIPLKIANIPVLVAPPIYMPAHPQGLHIPRPEDPYPVALDPLKIVPTEAIVTAHKAFPEAICFFVMFSGTFIAVYDSDQDPSMELFWNIAPLTFGTLPVLLMTADPEISSSRDSSALIRASTPKPVWKPASGSNSNEVQVIEAGSRISVRGAFFDRKFPAVEEVDRKNLPHIMSIYHHSEASLGVMIESEHSEQCLLTTVSHLFHEHQAAEIRAKGILGVDENTYLPTLIYGPQGNEPLIGLLHSQFDPNATTPYARGYECDLALLRMNRLIAIDMQYDPSQLSFALHPQALSYNSIIELLSTSPISGRSLRGDLGITVGQEFAANIVKNAKSAAAREAAVKCLEDTTNQISRSFLWRRWGEFANLGGASGTAVGKRSSDGIVREIIGFQNYQWPGNPSYQWGANDQEILEQKEDMAEQRFASSTYTIYGSFFLPSAVKGAKIVDRNGPVPEDLRPILDLLPDHQDRWIWETALFTLGGKDAGYNLAEPSEFGAILDAFSKGKDDTVKLDPSDGVLCALGRAFQHTTLAFGELGGLKASYDHAKKNGYFESERNEDELVAQALVQIGSVSVLEGVSRLLMARMAAASALCFFRGGAPPQQADPPPSPQGAPPPPQNFSHPQQHPSINVTTQIEAIREACKDLGTDEAMLIRVIGSADGPTIDAIRAGYQYTGGLIKTLESETSNNFKTALVATALGPLESLIFWANRSMSGAGTDEWMMTEALLGRTNQEMHMMKQIYHKMYRRSLESDVRADLSFKTQEFFLMAINTVKPEEWMQPNPVEIDQQTQAIYAATKGRPGTDETTVSRIVTSCNEAQLRAIALQFNRLHGDIIKMIKSEFSGHMKNALIYLFSGALNKPERDAKLLEDSMKGLGTRDAKLLEDSMKGLETRDDHLIMWVVRIHWDRQHLANVQAAYRNMYHRELANRIQGDTSGDYCKMLLQMVSAA